jgi:hypothetical protein
MHYIYIYNETPIFLGRIKVLQYNVSILLHTNYRCMYEIIPTCLNTHYDITIQHINIYIDTQ